MVGVGVAGVAIGATYVTGNPAYDAVGSIAVGGMLGAVAVFIINRNRAFLGGSVPPRTEQVRRIYAWHLHGVCTEQVRRISQNVYLREDRLALHTVAASITYGCRCAGCCRPTTWSYRCKTSRAYRWAPPRRASNPNPNPNPNPSPNPNPNIGRPRRCALQG